MPLDLPRHMNELLILVDLLLDWAAALGMTYEEINIWIFVILEPLVFVLMVVDCAFDSRHRRLRAAISKDDKPKVLS